MNKEEKEEKEIRKEEKSYKTFVKRAYTYLFLMFFIVFAFSQINRRNIYIAKSESAAIDTKVVLNDKEEYIKNSIDYQNELKENISKIELIYHYDKESLKKLENKMNARVKLIDSLQIELSNQADIPSEFTVFNQSLVQLVNDYSELSHSYQDVFNKRLNDNYDDSEDYILDFEENYSGVKEKADAQVKIVKEEFKEIIHSLSEEEDK